MAELQIKITFTEAQRRVLDALAEYEQRPMAAIIKSGVVEYAERRGQWLKEWPAEAVADVVDAATAGKKA